MPIVAPTSQAICDNTAYVALSAALGAIITCHTPQINQRRPDEQQQAPELSGPRDEDFIDTSMARPGKDAAAHRRRRGALEFVEEGSMARQAEIMRLKQKYGEGFAYGELPRLERSAHS